MSIKRFDARGLSCPQPVLLTQKAIEEGHTTFEVFVNTDTAKENVWRLVKKNGLQAEIQEMEGDTLISITRP